MGDQQILVRTRAVVFDAEGHLLVQRHAGSTPAFYRLPGGGVRMREKAEDCVVREVKEESGLDVTVVRLLWVRDFLEDGPYHSLELFFLAAITGGVFAPSPEGDRVDLAFMTLDELETQVFYPQALLPKLRWLRENRDWTESNPYLRSVN
jgi:8-oxo-dGTP diphosphatase